MVCHRITGSDRAILTESFEIFTTPEVLQMSVCNNKVGCEHGCSNFAAVCAATDKSVDQTWGFGGLRQNLLITLTRNDEMFW